MTQQILATTMTFGERTAYAGKMLLIGLGTVFIVLAVLWGALELFRRFLVSREVVTEEKPAPAPAPVQKAAAATPPVPAAPAAAGNDALIAVITAAVAAAMAEENGGVVPGFRVVSFRRL